MMARAYLDTWAGGEFFPKNWEPILGPQKFGGFHSTVSILLAGLNAYFSVPLPVSLKIINVIAFSFYDFSILFFLTCFFALKRGTFNLIHLLGFLSVSYLSPFPSRFLGSGGGAHVLASAFGVFVLGLVLNLYRNRPRSENPYLMIALLCLVSLSIHPMPIFHTLLLAPFFVCLFLFYHQKSMSLKEDFQPFFKLLIYAIIFCLPIVVTFSRPLGPYQDSIKLWISHVKTTYSISYTWQQDLPIFWGELLAFCFFILKQFGLHISILACIHIFVGRRTIIHQYYYHLFVIMLALMWFGSSLPFIGSAFYPDRMMQFGFIFLSVNLIWALSKLENVSNSRLVFAGTILVVSFFSITRFTWSYVIQAGKNVLLTEEDMQVIKEIPKFVEKNQMIETSYHDAGAWIPSLVGRPVSEPHYHLSMEMSWKEYKKNIGNQERKFIFTGSRCNQDPACKISCEGAHRQVLIEKGSSKFCYYDQEG